MYDANFNNLPSIISEIGLQTFTSLYQKLNWSFQYWKVIHKTTTAWV